MYCPTCGLGGRKDDACTHMKCIKCDTDWCYICGLKEADLDKENGDSIYQHNELWHENEARCPMYLTAINQLDKRWPLDDDECLEFFHN
jgi:hypothetical protein